MDADWTTCQDSKSIIRFVAFLGFFFDFLEVKKQATISRSSAEAECHSMAHATSEIVWLLSILHVFFVVHD